MSRKEIINEVEELMTSYCKDCFLHKHHKDEKGRRYAHRFCITECTVGVKIKSIGSKLS
ncbi:zinc-finger domain-containing protein [Cytobacillus firmus]|uniref:Zinc-finger domain-containing protein n=1 Tax=Cytobacillus firmus TaxID=1399 RepID=A0AA46P1V7_CYTFI|nr:MULTISPECIES: zinc-finger domain-containing protein [Bacillaceae]MBY6051501.1 zinc-finger domain-containing protein [Cytobacillus firmus]MCC3647964.1 zinc-finger domain-containing protein [Cytobacillus oceanisediminis]MCS0653937.1 zinc-finger domain-containing protein [Cytobacillus firmus]MCU1805871.1 zinc-finger domain-containing protein [Cytobacillus firmus]URT69515.1 zinc-finger domain-containing protein [Cytobacillus firmus]